MRTTLTLDQDVAVQLERLREDRKTSLKELVNDALRRGLRQMSSPAQRPKKPYRSRSVRLGRCLTGNLDDVSEALAVAEGEDFR